MTAVHLERRRFLAMLGGLPLVRVDLFDRVPVSDPMVIGRGLPGTIEGWTALVSDHAELVADRAEWIVLTRAAWARLVDDVAAAPVLLPYLPLEAFRLATVEGANCVGRALAMRSFLEALGWPIGAVRPVVCEVAAEGKWQTHMGLCIATTSGDFFIENIGGNRVAPWRAFPHRWLFRYADGIAWELLA